MLNVHTTEPYSLNGNATGRHAFIDQRKRQIYNVGMTSQIALQPLEYARYAADVASDKLASDIVMLDISDVSDFADYFVILSVESTRQMRAIVEDLEHALEGKGALRHHREGTPESGWMLLDFGDVVIHVFGTEERQFYNLESAWSEATEVVRIL